MLKNINNPLSYSQLSSYKSCPEKFKIIYLDGVRKQHESIESFVGKRVHATLEWLYDDENLKKTYITFDSLCEAYDDFWRKEWHKDIFIFNLMKNKKPKKTDFYYSMGKRCLSNYYEKYGPDFNQPVIGTEIELSFSVGNHAFRGVIDRLDQLEPGKWMVHDYKTSKKQKTKRQGINDIQLGLYHIAIEQNYDNVEEISLRWHFLRHGSEVTIVYDKEKLDKIKIKVIKIINDISSSLDDDNNFLPKETILCNWCYLWKECSIKLGDNIARRAD
jgi:CRISPR/Cas system-associated exonuclease Cas4 (RecB family)